MDLYHDQSARIETLLHYIEPLLQRLYLFQNIFTHRERERERFCKKVFCAYQTDFIQKFDVVKNSVIKGSTVYTFNVRGFQLSNVSNRIT